jgi:hypothetical protein
MTVSPWMLAAEKATLNLQGFSAEMDLGHPGLGLCNVNDSGAVVPAQVLGVAWGDETDLPHTLSECYVRGGDLIATYAPQPQQPFAPQAYWRVVKAAPPRCESSVPQMELLVSVQTQLLDAQPRMTAVSVLRAAEVLYLEDAAAGRFVALSSATGLPPSAACLLVRLADSPLSYVEMVHPHDFSPGHLDVAVNGENVSIRHTLIACRMEKGVIIRVRLRGSLIPRSDDVGTAAGLFAAFGNAALPLSA